MTQRGLSRARRVGLALGLVLTASLPVTPATAADPSGTDVLAARVVVRDGGDGDGVSLADVDDNRPLQLDPDRDVVLELRVENPQDTDVVLRTVRVEGRVLGMTFFDYATRVDRTVAAGATEDLSLPLDVSALGEQATGLLPAHLTLIGPDREVLLDDPFPVDVEGSLWSTYGVFGLLVAAITLVLLAAALVRLALGALPRHRWLRASRFAVPGLGLGLTLTFTLSVLGLLVPSAESWVAVVVGGGLLGLLAGFATPSPDAERRRDRAERAAADDAAPEPGTAQPDGTAAPVEDEVIVLPDDPTSVPPRPRGPHDVDVRSDARSDARPDARPDDEAELPPRPARRR